ncbi:MAG TPA: FtsX-like permease family protein [Bacteroidia bacterium]|jgi:lipoprotein-releasing system permease protein|nr:FtsX-like permease family protein [Bacteroidia bacterium]
MQKTPVLKIALTHLISKKRQTLVAMLGVTFGIAIFIFQAGLMSGFQTTFIEQTVNTTANIRIFNEAKSIRPNVIDRIHTAAADWNVVRNQKPKDEQLKVKNGYQIISLLEKDPDVDGVSPFLGSPAIFKLGIAEVSGRASGVDIVKENLIFRVSDYMVRGDLLKLRTITNGVILGAGLADKLGAKLNDNINVISPLGVTLEMKVVGIHMSGITEVDNTRAFINIRNAQKLLQVDGSYITDINIKLKDIDKAEVLAKKYEHKFGYRALDWKEANSNIFGIFKIQNLITYLIICSILIVSGFGIFNILMMIIYEKMGDIAILKAIGFKDTDIRKIFLTESLVIGIIGGLLGLVLGFILQKIIGSIKMDIKGFVSMEYLKFNSSPGFYVFAYVFALVVTAVAGYIPARKASKLDPIDIIRSK